MTTSIYAVGQAYARLAVLPYARALDAPTITALAETYTAAEVSDQELLEAAAWAAQTQPTWPAPATLIQRARAQRARSQGQPDETPSEAWGAVIREMQGWSGSEMPPSLSRRAQAAFCAAFGPSWRGFWATAMSADMVAHRARYIEAYGSGSALDQQLLAHELRKRESVHPRIAQAFGIHQRERIPYSQLPSDQQDPEDVANYVPETCPDDNPYDPADTEGYADGL